MNLTDKRVIGRLAVANGLFAFLAAACLVVMIYVGTNPSLDVGPLYDGESVSTSQDAEELQKANLALRKSIRELAYDIDGFRKTVAQGGAVMSLCAIMWFGLNLFLLSKVRRHEAKAKAHSGQVTSGGR